jgi:hypothetical protein
MSSSRFVAWIASLGLFAVLGCASSRPDPQPAVAPAPAPGCAADGLGPLKPAADHLDKPACGEGAACGDACLRNDGLACFARGVELQGEGAPSDVADAMYLRACRLGLPIGCTNYAAGLWFRQDAAAPCAERLFQLSCAAGEAWGCGMLGRMIVEAGKEIPRGREILERSCQKLGRFPCRVLALQIERGTVGPSDAATVQKLLARACETGDPDACGPPPNAESTFH